MPDRVIRDELLESERFLDLPCDTDRLAYVGLRLRTDDFGNMEAGERRIFRLLHQFTQVKTPEAAAVVMAHLADSDMVRFYKSGDPEREFIHLPRSRPTGSYLVRKCPPSPWCDPEVLLGKHIRTIRNQGLAKNVTVTSQERNKDVSQGVGVGKGKLHSRAVRAATDDGAETRRATWQAYSDAYEFRHGAPPLRDAKANSAIKTFCKSVPASECPHVAAFYVTNNNSFYVSKKHPPTLLASDAAKLRTEWVTGQQTTQTEAIQADKTAARKNVFVTLINEAKKREQSTE